MVFGLAERRLKELRGAIKINETVCETYRAIETSAESTLRNLDIKTVYVCDGADLVLSLKHILSCNHVLGLDIETYGLPAFAEDKQGGLEPRKSSIRLVQFYDGEKTVYVFDILKLGGIETISQEIWDKPMVAHNAMFELKHLLHKGAHPKKLGCTLLADRVINGNRADLLPQLGLSKSAGLKDLAKELLGLEVSKELQTSDWSSENLSQEQLEYAALDAVLVPKIFLLQGSRLQKQGLSRAYGIMRDAQHAIAKMELWGIGFNVERHKESMTEWLHERDTFEKDILETLGRDLNMNSSKQLGEWLREALKQDDLEVWLKTSSGQLSTSTPTFKLNEHLHAIFPKIVEYRYVAKRLSSFGESLYKYIETSENRLYGSFTLGTTSTGRMASRHPNMQNMPRKGFRELFVAKEGYVLTGLDYSQQELRVAALVAQDKELLRVYEVGEDAHINTAAMILNIPKDKVGKEHRQLAKALNFGLIYGQGTKGLAVYAKRNYGVDMTEDEAEKHRAKFFKIYKGLREWQYRTGSLTKITQIIKTPCGRIRDFNKDKNGYRYTAALNLPIQGAAAEITLYALIKLIPHLCDNCRLVNVIHDEILLEVREELAQEYAEKAKQAMEEAFIEVFPNAKPYMKGLVEAKIGKNWGETK